MATAGATLSTVASTDSSTAIIASNAGRQGLMVFNTDANILYLKYGATASATDFTVQIGSNVLWEMPEPVYTGAIDGIWAADGSGSAYITEL